MQKLAGMDLTTRRLSDDLVIPIHHVKQLIRISPFAISIHDTKF